MIKENLTSDRLQALKLARWKARTDLLWLCNNVLQYKDVCEKIHGGLLNVLQKFPKPNQEQFEKNDRFVAGKWIYEPIKPLEDLLCSSRVLILDSRGFLKTSINMEAHTIQWILNYPNIAIQILQSNTEKAQGILRAIKQHFVGNPRMRELFPEHCPKKKLLDWGTQDYFNTEARDPSVVRREFTCTVGSSEKGSAGLHFDVMKFSDMVDPNNSKTAEQCQAVINNFSVMENVLVSPKYWIDVEGTRYSFSDLYGDIIKKQLELPPKDRTWKFYINSCFERETYGVPRTYGPEELKLPFKRTEDGRPISRWPERFPLENLLEKQRTDPRTFANQQLNSPIASADGRTPFPVDDHYPKWKTRQEYAKVNIVYREITVDTAETISERSDYSAITVGGWDAANRLYIENIYHGKFMPDEFIKILINAIKMARPRCVKIEETGYVRGLKPSLLREMQLKGLYIPIEFIKRDNETSKKERILNTLQPWYKSGQIYFLDDLYCKQQLLTELSEFPSGSHDDILDTIADMFQNKEWFGREMSRAADPAEAAHRMQQQADLEFLHVVKLVDPFLETEPEQIFPGPNNHIPTTIA